MIYIIFGIIGYLILGIIFTVLFDKYHENPSSRILLSSHSDYGTFILFWPIFGITITIIGFLSGLGYVAGFIIKRFDW